MQEMDWVSHLQQAMLVCFSIQSYGHVNSILTSPWQWQPTAKFVHEHHWAQLGYRLHAVFSPPQWAVSLRWTHCSTSVES